MLGLQIEGTEDGEKGIHKIPEVGGLEIRISLVVGEGGNIMVLDMSWQTCRELSALHERVCAQLRRYGAAA